MGNAENIRPQPLEVGQLWKLEHDYLYIVELGQRLIRYKILRQPNTNAITQMMRIEALVNFLSHSDAQLVGNDVVVPFPFAPWLAGSSAPAAGKLPEVPSLAPLPAQPEPRAASRLFE